MRRKCIIFFKYFLKFFFNLLFDCVAEDWRYVCLQKKKSYKIYRSFKRSYIETYFTIIEIGISISLGIIPGICFCVGFFCSIFVLDFVSLIFSRMWMIFPVVVFSFHGFSFWYFVFIILFSFENESSLLFCCIAMLVE